MFPKFQLELQCKYCDEKVISEIVWMDDLGDNSYVLAGWVECCEKCMQKREDYGARRDRVANAIYNGPKNRR
jgi:hypothetical protein